jgi:ABC-type Fe3+-siderophore transport system permease subunit
MRRLVSPSRRRGALALLAGLVVLAGLVELASGSVAIGPGQALAIVAAEFGISTPWSFEPTQAAVLLAIRGPRMVTAIVVGAGLAVAGAAMQGLFRNPLADPGLLGVTSGAAVGVAAALLGVVPGLQLLSAGAAAPLAQARCRWRRSSAGCWRRRWWSGWRRCAGAAAWRGCCWRASP